MKKYKIVNDILEKELMCIFPNINDMLHKENIEMYSMLSISFFNHCLSKEESIVLLDSVPKKEQQKRDERHFLFFKLLLKKMSVFAYIYIKSIDQHKLVEFRSKNEFLKYIKKASTFYIIIPDIESIYVSGFDDTNRLYYKNKKMIVKLELLIKKSSLYLLDKDYTSVAT